MRKPNNAPPRFGVRRTIFFKRRQRVGGLENVTPCFGLLAGGAFTMTALRLSSFLATNGVTMPYISGDPDVSERVSWTAALRCTLILNTCSFAPKPCPSLQPIFAISFSAMPICKQI